jgi:nucleotide-binding universal stress UspA family protein
MTVPAEPAPTEGRPIMTGTIHGILVGYDGSPGGERALGWAVQEARWRGTGLTICHAWAPEYCPGPPGESDTFDRAQRAGEQNLAQALRFARNVMGPGRAQPLLAAGPAAPVLCEHSSDADMVVVGARGRGGLPGALLGSVSQQVCAHARGRVVVVRGHWHQAAEYLPGPVVVGADGSAASHAAIAFAAEEAAFRAVPLQAVCALADTPGTIGGAGRMQEALDQDIARWEKRHPELTILRQITFGQPRTVLLEAAAGAQLLVVGDRGRGGVEGMLLGSVSQAVVQHATCPVGIVHPQ